jgi:hypothetical protein
VSGPPLVDWRRCPGCGLEWPHPSCTSGLYCPRCLAAREREACAKEAARWVLVAGERLAAAIRARGTMPPAPADRTPGGD